MPQVTLEHQSGAHPLFLGSVITCLQVAGMNHAPTASSSGSASTVYPTISCMQANLVSLPLTWKHKMGVLFRSDYSQVLIELTNNTEKPYSETSFDI